MSGLPEFLLLVVAVAFIVWAIWTDARDHDGKRRR